MKNKKRLYSERVELIVGFVFIFTAFLVSLYYNGDEKSIFELIPNNFNVPLTAILLPIVHGTLSLWAFVLIFKPNQKHVVIILFIESFVTIQTGTEMLGIFFFYAAITLYQLSEDYNTLNRKPLIFITIIHFLCFFATYRHGWPRVCLEIGTSTFYLVFFMFVYFKLREKFASFLHKSFYQNEKIIEKAGGVLHLKEYGLTDRQISIIKEYVNQKTPYKVLAEKYITSLSSIKKDFSIVFQKFGVSDIQELNFILSQYQLED